jgi:hypothetical protein
MILKFTALKIANIEDETGKNFIDLLSTASVKNMLYFVKEGAGLSSLEEASNEIEKYLSEGKTLLDLQTLLFTVLAENRFLQMPEKADETLKKNLQQAKK